MMVKTCNKNVHPGHPNLRAWDNHPEHCHSRDQVIIVMIMTGNDHFPLLHSSRSKLFFIVSNILTFFIGSNIFRSTLRDLTPGATYEIQLFTVFLNFLWSSIMIKYHQLWRQQSCVQWSSIMIASCVQQWWCAGLPEQGVAGLYFYKLHNQAKHTGQVKVQIQTQ